MIHRRQFLAHSIAAAGLFSVERGSAQPATVSNAVAVPDSGWRLWLDTKAEWNNDVIYLPEDVILEKLPVNEPTSGWEALNSSAGIGVDLPATVEQFYWGISGFRHYKDEYKFETDDPAVKN